MSVDFDAGVNSSAAWTAELSLSDEETEHGHHRRLKSLPAQFTPFLQDLISPLEEGDEEGDSESYEEGKPARAVYDFTGQIEYRELTFKAGDVLEILKEEVVDDATNEEVIGWSLARCNGEVGLAPRTYYTYTANFTSSNAIDGLPISSTEDITPRASQALKEIQDRSAPSPIIPQTTGEWFRLQQLQLPSFRRSLLGGKSLNRFSSFVTSGAEEYVLWGPPALAHDTHAHIKELSEGSEESTEIGKVKKSEQHYIEYGLRWKSKVPRFSVRVHSPEKRVPPTISGGASAAYTAYNVTSIFDTISVSSEDTPFHEHCRSWSSPEEGPTPAEPTHEITVQRRFSHFVFLHATLSRMLPGIALPPLPEKQYAGRFSDAFVEARRADLQRYLQRIVRHPLVRYAEVLMFFLGCDNDLEWQRRLPYFLSQKPLRSNFYSQVYHPEFQIQTEDAEGTCDRFVNHVKAADAGVQQLRGIFGKVRNARIEMSNAERIFSYSLLSLITCKPLATAVDENEDGSLKRKSIAKGLVNEDGAWCWREDCSDCLRFTKRMQKVSESLQSVSDLYDYHGRQALLERHDSYKEVAHSSVVYAPVVDTHKAALIRYKEAQDNAKPEDDVVGRCETVVSTTMAEFDLYHDQKREDFENLTKGYLDGEIQFCEKVLARLRAARQVFETSDAEIDLTMPGPCQPSVYESELVEPLLRTSSIPLPPPHVFDSAPMRPVSVAIQDGVSLLFGGAGLRTSGVRSDLGRDGRTNSGRASVFSKFW
ncbi:hypothetical protein SCHPADRAFT_903340 [Schizopora paradoxa]|uniref:PX-domain-containing protein n=1 Tax=Schizopora paradoxa TaxID=27342 RepID=A0A0H2RR77_9AGAM|nr:hypothetical protein SCHPADRAFT_903340 [Schizopora paradoxa]